MENLKGYSEFNPKNELTARSYVDNNIRQLIQSMNIEEEDYESIEDIKSELIKYFTKFPDQISSFQIRTTGYPRSMNLSTNNIGGVVKYR
jgi:hypothetical protein